MRIFNKGTKAFHFFLNKNFQYSTKNAMRIAPLMHPKDVDRYKFDASDLDWSELLERNFLGVRQYYFREKGETSLKHVIVYALYVYKKNATFCNTENCFFSNKIFLFFSFLDFKH